MFRPPEPTLRLASSALPLLTRSAFWAAACSGGSAKAAEITVTAMNEGREVVRATGMAISPSGFVDPERFYAHRGAWVAEKAFFVRC